MTNPITHLLWGYVLSERLTREPKYLLLGSFMAILMDVDGAPFSWLPHRGFMHTPAYLFLICGLVYVGLRYLPRYHLTHSEAVPIVALCYVTLLSHLVLDTIGSNWAITWGWPLIDTAFTLGDHISFSSMVVIKLILLCIPLGIVWKKYRETGRSPLDLYEYLKGEVGVWKTNALIVLFVVGVGVYYIWPQVF